MFRKLIKILPLIFICVLTGCAASSVNKYEDMTLWSVHEYESDKSMEQSSVPEEFDSYMISSHDKDIRIFSLTNNEKGFFDGVFDVFSVYTPSYTSYEEAVTAFDYFVNNLSEVGPYVIVAEKSSADTAIRLYLENIANKPCGERLISLYALMPGSENGDIQFLPINPVEETKKDEAESNPIYSLRFDQYKEYLAEGEGDNGRIVIHDAKYDEDEVLNSDAEIKYQYSTDLLTNIRRRNNNYHLLAGLSSPNKTQSADSFLKKSEEASDVEFVRKADGVNDAMLTVDYWIDKLKDPDKILMTKESIAKWNEMVIDSKNRDGIDFYRFFDGTSISLSKDELEKAVNELGFTESQLYRSNGEEITQEMIDEIALNKNLEGIKDENPIEYAVIVRKTDVRILPTDIIASTEADNDMYCEWQNSSATINEPAIIVHRSADNEWCYLYTRYCGGWVKDEDVAVFQNYQAWKKAMSPENFIVITEDNTTIDINTKEPSVSGLELFMADKFEVISKDELAMNEEDRVGYDCYAALIPTRNSYGNVKYVPTYISASKAHLGYLDYTNRNVLTQAFKMDGDRYGWGGMYRERDCSHVVEDIYRCFGFAFSRGGALSNTYIDTLYIKDMSDSAKIDMLKKIKPGSFLYFPGHIMLYVGVEDDTPYVISYTGSFFIDGEKIKIHGNFVSPLSLVRGNGRTWLDSLEKIKIMPEY